MPVEHVDADVAVVGSGFAGSLTALCLRRRGRRVVLVERGRHPRFAIGESSTPLANLLLEELADRYDLPRIRVFSKWGTWQRARPDVAGGLKRGFTFFFHRAGEAFADDRATRAPAARRGQPARRDRRHALVPAGLRPRARARSGSRRAPSISRRRDSSASAKRDSGGDARRYAQRSIGPHLREVRDRRQRACAGFSIGRSASTTRRSRWLPPTQGLYTHFEGVERWDQAACHPTGRRPIRPMTRRCITCFPAAGSGCCDSTTASRARAPR